MMGSRYLRYAVTLSLFSLVPITPLWSSANPSPASSESRSLEAVRLAEDERIRLDGHLDEPLWQRATPATRFLQQEPREGEAASEETVVYILYDRDNLYIGVILYDSDVDAILAYQRKRDGNIWTDDRFMWIFDTFMDGRTGYFFEINPLGLMGDGLLGGGGFSRFPINKSWDGIWEVQVAMLEDGWSAEIRIPFRTLNFDPGQDTWGINFQRTIPRKNEDMLWSGHRRNQGLFRPVHAGRLTGLRDISQGIGLEAKPYAATGWRNTPGVVDTTDIPADVGLDLTYSITPSLRAAITINTDFAEVEVDDRRVNLTRFPLFYPEQRDFFLEGSGVFSFAPRNGVIPYFSRRIGLVEEEQIPITYGTRLGGQVGRYELGFIQARAGRHGSLHAEDFTVGRVKRFLFEQSSIGALYTRRSSGVTDSVAAQPDRHTAGVDLDLYSSRFRGNKNLQFEAFVVWNSDPEVDTSSSFGDLSARGVRLNYPNDIWRVHISYREIGEDFDPAVGFTRRNGFKRVNPSISYQPRPENIAAIRQLEFGVFFEYLTDFSNTLQTRSIDVDLLGIEFESDDDLKLELKQRFERLDEAFDIHEDIVIPVGDYSTLALEISGRTARRRALAGNIEISRGGFWSGHRWNYEIGITARPYTGISLSTEIEKNDISLPEGDFSTHLFRLVGGWDISPWMSVTGNLQYDDVSEIVGLNARFRWILRPGSDLYIVYTHNWQDFEAEGVEPGILGLTTLSRSAMMKINYTHRF